MKRAILISVLACGAMLAPAARADSDARALFLEKCLFCHSSAPIMKQRLSLSEWRKVVARMRGHAPLLIDAAQAATIVQHLVGTLHLVPRVAAHTPRHRPEPRPTPTDPVQHPLPVAITPEPTADPVVDEPPAAPADPEAEEKGPRLLEERCSKCHSTYRVYTKIDKLSVGLSVLERMRHKTGANITPADADLLARFLRTRIDP